MSTPRSLIVSVVLGLVAPGLLNVPKDLGAWSGSFTLSAQDAPYSGVREKLERLVFPPLRFDPPEPRVETIRGVKVFFLPDHTLPLVSVYASFRGGYGRFPRSQYAASMALPALLRTGGTTTLSPDSVDERVESLALGMSFGQGGGTASASFNSLKESLPEAFDLWGDLLKNPRFDSSEVEVWRGRELERVRRRVDNPGLLAFSEFNRLLFGDHPVGWEMAPEDLEPSDLAVSRLREIHQTIICPENMLLAVAGDLEWAEARTHVDALLADWQACPGELPQEPEPDIRSAPGVFVIHKDIAQSQVVMAHSSSLRQGDSRAYFASRIGNSILGSSGLSSRLMREVRTRTGYAYAAASLWSVAQERDGLIGAITQTRPETTIDAIELIQAAFDSLRTTPPTAEELDVAIEEIVNGFVFNFQSPFQIAARRLAFERLDLPEDWLERFVEGISDVSREDVQETFATHADPGRFTILIVGDTSRFGSDLDRLGEVVFLTLDGPTPSQESGEPAPPYF